MPLPVDSTHLSDQARTEMIEDYAGGVESQFAKSSIMRQYTMVNMIRGTDTLIERRVGRTVLKAVVDGVRPDADKTEFGRVGVTVDTVVLARDNRSMLNEFQTDFNARAELAKDHGKELGKFFDEAFIIQAIKGAGAAAPAGLNGAFGAGKSSTLALAGDELDPDKLYTAISDIIVQMQEEEIDTEECVIFVRPTQYNVLLSNDKLLDRDFAAGNGDFAKGLVRELYGVRIEKTTRIPTAVITGHFLSNVNNSDAYDIDATEAKTTAVILHPKSLLAGETVPLTSDVWYNKEELQWFIDSYLAFGVSVKRPDVCGRVLTA